MADYYPLIARAISGLDVNSTGEQRRALYERARSALIAQLRGVQPPLSESDITRERLTLEEAIRKVESEAAARARAAARGDTSRRPGDSLRTPPAAGGLRDRPPVRPDRPVRDGEPTPPSRPRVDDRLFSREPREPRDRDRPSLAQRRERTAERPGERAGNGDRPERPSRERPAANGVRGFRDVMADADELGGAAAEANRSARRTYNQVPSPTPEFERTEPSLEDRTADAAFDPPANRDREPAPALSDNAPYSYDESAEEAERYAQRQPSPLRSDRPGRERPPLRTFPVKRIAVLGVVLILLGLLVVFWPNLRGMFLDMSASRPKVADTPKQQPAASGERPKITDRVGQPSDSPIAPVAQRVVLYDEDPAEPQGKQYVGQVVWRTENVPGTSGQAADLAIRADIDIPERKFKASMSIRRNNDTSLPASHTVEMTFTLPPDFAGGGIANVPGVLMKSNEQTRGTPLAGLAVKVTDNFYLIGLSNVETDRGRNIQLLKERSWFDIPLVYTNQRRAIIALEKGAPGERAFTDAFAVWKQ